LGFSKTEIDSGAEPLMPQGVEHWQFKSWVRVIACAEPLMPQGVEHVLPGGGAC
jgi:hypothetical protein